MPLQDVFCPYKSFLRPLSLTIALSSTLRRLFQRQFGDCTSFKAWTSISHLEKEWRPEKKKKDPGLSARVSLAIRIQKDLLIPVSKAVANTRRRLPCLVLGLINAIRAL